LDNFLGQKVDGKGKEYAGQSSNLNPIGRYASSPVMCTSSTIRNLRFFILLKALVFNGTIVGLGERNTMPRILSDP
jgi:hypothetical protein